MQLVKVYKSYNHILQFIDELKEEYIKAGVVFDIDDVDVSIIEETGNYIVRIKTL